MLDTHTAAPTVPAVAPVPHGVDVVAPTDRVDPTTIPGLAGHACLHYQPQLDLQSGAILSAEALLRWWHPRFGLLSPYASLAGTRWADRINGLEAWAASEACDQGARWSDEGLPIQIALNVSPSNLVRPGLASSLRAELDRTGVAAPLLSIDVPFAAFVSDRRGTERAVRSLARHSIGVVLDGVPSEVRLAGLADLGADAWKIELRTLRGGGIHPSVRHAVEQAHAAGATAIAKAVEDDATFASARSMGFDGVFGNIVCEPLSGAAVRDRFRSAPLRLPPLFGASAAATA
jgi:EAL domain-containing protein (putative c-di-GMP-specific phosphodiesterase class I)